MRAKLDSIIEIIARHHTVPILVIKGDNSFTDYVQIRHKAQYLSYHFLNKHGRYYESVFGNDESVKSKSLSLVGIGKIIGNVTHTTVINSLKTISNYVETNAEYRKSINELVSLIMKEADFGSRRAVLKDSDRNASVEVLLDKKSCRYFRVETKNNISIYNQAEINSIIIFKYRLENTLDEQEESNI